MRSVHASLQPRPAGPSLHVFQIFTVFSRVSDKLPKSERTSRKELNIKMCNGFVYTDLVDELPDTNYLE
jgi:hypothetical protein